MTQSTLESTADEPVMIPARDVAIETSNLVKVYGGGTRALDGITFQVARGEPFGFLGPNGAGKTTTIRILATLLGATSGIARVVGLDVAAEPHEVRKRLGIALQTPTLDTFSTGRETLQLAGRLRGAGADQPRGHHDAVDDPLHGGSRSALLAARDHR